MYFPIFNIYLNAHVEIWIWSLRDTSAQKWSYTHTHTHREFIFTANLIYEINKYLLQLLQYNRNYMKFNYAYLFCDY